MGITKREFILTTTAAGALGFSGLMRAGAASAAVFAPQPGSWRRYEITTTLDLSAHDGAVQAWVPLPSFSADDWMRPGETMWAGDGAEIAPWSDPDSGASALHARWDAGATDRRLTVRNTFEGRDRAVLPDGGDGAALLTAAERRRYTAPSQLVPLDGIVAETAAGIVAGEASDLGKARAIYEWVVDNTFRNPKTRGCGLGDIRFMLQTGDLSGKCADLNTLYVGLARASGLPARDVYGIRVAPSEFGYKSLGANSPTITKAQHCRAEVFVEAVGWVPVDPADVRKVVLEEPPGNLPLESPKVTAAREALFGSWETNWLAYNDAHDLVLPGSDGASQPFLMYPQALTETGWLDPLEPGEFAYEITAREIGA